MDGLLLLDKPAGYTSFDVVAKMRGLLHTRKVGHGGTLDPMATGVLPIFVGRGTKCCDILPCQDKRYSAWLQLGAVSDTQDSSGSILERRPFEGIGRREVEAALNAFVGEITQVPPMYSAVQVGGRRLYDLARQGLEVERPARQIRIYSIRLLEADEQAGRYQIDVSCGKGTYIRTLIHDLGQALGCGALMCGLRRTEAAGFGLEEALTLEEAQVLAQEGRLEERILPVERVFRSLPELRLSAAQCRLYRNGVRLDWNRLSSGPIPQGDLRVLGEDGAFIGVGFVDPASGQLCSRQLFALL